MESKVMESNVFNELVVVKRSGQRVPFNGTKIAIAIKKAFDSVYEEHSEDNVNKIYSIVLKYIIDNYGERKTITVEAIQDIIEYILKQEKYLDVYNSFNSYRLRRTASREVFDKKQQHKFVKATEKLISNVEDEEINPFDLLFKFGKTISNEFTKAYLIDSKYVRGHEEGNIFIHDLDYYVLGSTFSTHVDLSYINNYNNYFQEVLNVLLNIKKEQCGETTISSIDYVFEPWLIFEFKKLLKENIIFSLELEGFNKYINIKYLESVIDKLNEVNIPKNTFDNFTYTDRAKEIFNKSYDKSINDLKNILFNNLKCLLLTLNEDKYKICNDSNYLISLGTNNSFEGNIISEVYINLIDNLFRLDNVTTVYKLNNNISKLISKLLIENKNIAFSNINTSFNRKYLISNNYKTEVEYFSDGERILENVIDKNQISIGRSIISKVSINLVRIALKSNNIKEFYSELDNTLEFAKNELLQAFEYISNKYKKSYKYSFNNILIDSDKLDDDKRIRKVIKNGTLNIGYTGLKECLYILSNKEELINDDIKIGIDILKFMKDKCDNFIEENKLNFVLFENTNKNILEYFRCLDKSIYGSIKNVTNNLYEPFYTIFDNIKINIEDRLKIESKMQKYSNGGYYEIFNIPKNSSYKKIDDTLNIIKENDIGFFRIRVGKNE